MPSKTLKRLLRGGLAGGRGVLRGNIAAAQEEEERRLQRNRQLVDWLTTESRMGVNKARQAYYEQQAEPKPPDQGKWKPLGKTGYLYNELTGETMMAVDEAGGLITEPDTKRPADITGIGDVGKVESERERKTNEARRRAGESIITAFPDFFLPGADAELKQLPLSLLLKEAPETLAANIRGSVSPTVERDRPGWGTGADTVVNPDLAAIDSILSNISIAPRYKRAIGDHAVALLDSVETAREDPGMAGALRDFMPQADEQVGQAITLNSDEQDLLVKIRRNPELIETRDWEAVQRANPHVDVQRVLNMARQ